MPGPQGVITGPGGAREVDRCSRPSGRRADPETRPCLCRRRGHPSDSPFPGGGRSRPYRLWVSGSGERRGGGGENVDGHEPQPLEEGVVLERADRLLGAPSGSESSPAGCAHRALRKAALEDHPGGSQPIDVRCLNKRTGIAADCVESLLLRTDPEDVGWSHGRLLSWARHFGFLCTLAPLLRPGPPLSRGRRSASIGRGPVHPGAMTGSSRARDAVQRAGGWCEPDREPPELLPEPVGRNGSPARSR